MPAGVSWRTYLTFSFAAGLSMVLGAQTVHRVYRPLDDCEEFVKRIEEERKFLKELKSAKKNSDIINK